MVATQAPPKDRVVDKPFVVSELDECALSDGTNTPVNTINTRRKRSSMGHRKG